MGTAGGVAEPASQASVARLARLARDRRYRDAHGLAVLEGPRALDGALACGAEVTAVFRRPEQAAAPLGGRAGHSYQGPLYEISGADLRRAADTVNPQGVIATVRAVDSEVGDVYGAQRVVLLDQLRNPGNVGAVIRTAVAAGFDAVVATVGTADIFGPKSQRAAAGLSYALAVLRDADTAGVLSDLGKAGHLRVRAAVDGDVDLSELAGRVSEAGSPPVTLVVGNEAAGPSAEAVAGTDLAVSIPMRPPVDSLNVGVAAGVLLYALGTQ